MCITDTCICMISTFIDCPSTQKYKRRIQYKNKTRYEKDHPRSLCCIFWVVLFCCELYLRHKRHHRNTYATRNSCCRCFDCHQLPKNNEETQTNKPNSNNKVNSFAAIWIGNARCGSLRFTYTRGREAEPTCSIFGICLPRTNNYFIHWCCDHL